MMKSYLDVEGKICLITGASGGIGQAVAKMLAENNATVVLHYNTNPTSVNTLYNQIIENGGNALLVKADIRNEDEVREMIKTIISTYGRIDCLVNNSGILQRGFLTLLTKEKFQESIDVNLLGNFLVLKHVSSQMISKKSGTIVNVSSAAGVQGIIGQSVYSSTKAGLNAITVVAAKELAGFNIRVNAVAPGFIATGMLEKPNEKDLKYNEFIPLKRFGEASEVASVVAFLLSSASSYMTGQVIVIDGGLLIS